MRKKVIIMGAGGRDFHNFNVFYKDNPEYEVVAFTAGQIPGIENRVYPPDLAGELYPNGIPIVSEDKLQELILTYKVNEVVFSYSDVSYNYVMQKASIALANGASFKLIGTESMLKSSKPVISVCATRTGSGKSPTSRYVVKILRDLNLKTVVVRHPMPYGNLNKQRIQRFEKLEDLDRYECTIEEREEYEPHIREGAIVYAGVDYKEILNEIEKYADIIVWDGGNNDFPFYKPDLAIVVTDPYRVGHELTYYPSEINLYLADIFVISKVDTEVEDKIRMLEKNLRGRNPQAKIVYASFPIYADPELNIEGKKVLVIEDGPTVTHGEMPYGAGYLYAISKRAEIIDARPYAIGSILDAYNKYPHINKVLPALGYNKEQLRELEEVISRVPADYVIIGTPVDLRSIIKIPQRSIRVYYQYKEEGSIFLKDLIIDWLKSKNLYGG